MFPASSTRFEGRCACTCSSADIAVEANWTKQASRSPVVKDIYIYIYNAVPISGRSIDRYWDTVTWVIVELTSEHRWERSVVVDGAAAKLEK